MSAKDTKATTSQQDKQAEDERQKIIHFALDESTVSNNAEV